MTLKKISLLFLINLIVISVLLAQEGRKIVPPRWEKEYPEVPVPDNILDWGKHIQRTMTLLATSTPEKRNTVRILFYGQSITANKKWTDAVVSDLINRFPHAHIIYENLAIGGFSSQFLVNSSESDMYPFYPDLVIFHVYGAHKEYQEIIHNLRSRTTSEVAIVSDHLGAKEYDGKEFYDPGDWDNFMRKTFIPAVAKEYKAQLIDITTPWKEYLKSNNLTSTEKAILYHVKYKNIIASDPWCIGSYVFLWTGYRQETTHTWYNMFHDDGSEIGSVEVMQYVWSGDCPGNRSPRLVSLTIDGMNSKENIALAPRVIHSATVDANDPDSDTLEYEWELVPENKVFGAYAGQGETKPQVAVGAIKERIDNGKIVEFEVPDVSGDNYRLFVYVYDGKGKVAVANIPFHVK